MAVNKIDKAVIANYQTNLDANNELLISGVYQGTPVRQNVPIPREAGSVLFFDPSNLNFYAVQLEGFEPHWKLVEVLFSEPVIEAAQGNNGK